MKRYLGFAFDRYYPSGGLNDLKFNFDKINEIDLGDESQLYFQYYQVFDTKTLKSTGFSLYHAFEEYEEEHGDVDYGKEEHVRKGLLIEWIKEFVKENTDEVNIRV